MFMAQLHEMLPLGGKILCMLPVQKCSFSDVDNFCLPKEVLEHVLCHRCLINTSLCLPLAGDGLNKAFIIS